MTIINLVSVNNGKNTYGIICEQNFETAQHSEQFCGTLRVKYFSGFGIFLLPNRHIEIEKSKT
jgi:hypothetical protein